METVRAVLLFAVGLVLLIKGGDWFVDGAVGVAHRFRLPEILIGATVVSIGTTLPEVMVSATSAAEGHSEISYGNAIGSVICNTALIAAITLAVRPGTVQRKSLRLPVIFFFLAAVFYSVISYTTGVYSRWVGFLLLALFLVYMTLSVLSARKNSAAEAPAEPGADKPAEATTGEPQPAEATDSADAPATPVPDAAAEKKKANKALVKDLIFLVIGAAFIAVGARLLVDNGTILAAKIGVPESVIALTFVALGTSLPELITAITSLVKGHSSLSLGNIIGANLFNLVLVSGLSIAIRPFSVPQSATVAGVNTSLLVEIPLMLAVMLLLVLPAMIRGKLYRWQGITLLALYAAFCTFQFLIPVL